MPCDAAAPASGVDAGSAAGASSDKSDARRNIGVQFPPPKSLEELSGGQQDNQRAQTTQADAKASAGDGIPPVVRSVLELGHLMMLGHSSKLRACPGYQGGLFYRGKPFCIACGYRDGTGNLDMDDTANHMRLKDPMVYGQLSIPVTTMLLCQLHQEGLWDMEKPLVDYCPELGERYDRLTARSILKYQTVLDESTILRDAGASPWRPLVARNPCRAMQDHVYAPITRFLAAGSKQPLSGQEQRKHFLEYLRSSSTMPKPRTVMLQRGRLSHFSLALLVAVVETQLRGVSFEETMRKKIFEPAQAHAAGYGAPKTYRDPSDMFYKPTGQAMQHERFKVPVPMGALQNCAPPLFNGSLNLYAPSEDFAKLLLLSVDTIRKAREVLGPETVAFPHYDFGVRYRPDRDEYSLNRSPFTGLDFIPTSSSFAYSANHDLGVFALSSCGSRGGRLFSNGFARVLQHLFIEHVSKKGIDPDKTSDDPAVEKTETEKKFTKLTKGAEYKTVFKKHDAHKRF